MNQNYANIIGKEGKDQWQYTAEVGSFPANKFGLYDMHGNVWEWMQDSWHKDYKGAPQDGGIWEGKNAARVIRGGSWNNPNSWGMRSAFRNLSPSGSRSSYLGFRLSLGHLVPVDGIVKTVLERM